ncbi:sulfurtransferase [Agaribacterium sp. ZY112]|uniref:sulfurtransferase n=1 Tax=Agaribacterium sp. ZY112 TaxID=3233574 RepID=UPI0035232CB7
MSASDILISVEELQRQIEQGLASNICIVDLSSRENYLNGHVPGAVFLPFQALLWGQPPIPGKIAAKEQLEQVFSMLGLDSDTQFIVYDDEGGGWAGRFIWTLDVIGHSNYRYLNGGLHAWNKAGFALETDINQRPEKAVSIDVNQDLLIEIPNILQGLEKQNICIWDARSPSEYDGSRALAAKAGHMPGAINCEWTELMDSNNGLIIRKDAKEYLASLGIDGSKTIITHCQGHHRSGFTYLVGKTLGLTIEAYHGAWNEWGNHPDTPVEQ